MIFLSSNNDKLKEIQKYGIEGKLIYNLPEVLSTQEDVLIRKNVLANLYGLKINNYFIEDSILEIFDFNNNKWQEIVDIKFQIEKIPDNIPIRWCSNIAQNKNNTLYLYKESLEGIYKKPTKFYKNSFGFDNYFYPEGFKENLHELFLKNKKDSINPRITILEKLKKQYFQKKIPITCDLIDWKGEWQNNYSEQDFFNKYNFKYLLINDNGVLKGFSKNEIFQPLENLNLLDFSLLKHSDYYFEQIKGIQLAYFKNEPFFITEKELEFFKNNKRINNEFTRNF